MRVTLAPYSPLWPLAFERERQRLQQALGEMALSIDHIGSTSVPGLAAKPILDILVMARDEPAPLRAFERALAPLGYFAPWDVDPRDPTHLFFRDDDRPRTRNLHVWPASSGERARHLAFRDALRADDALRDEYEALKRRLAEQEWGQIQDYADAKGDFIRRVEKQGADS